MRILGFSHVTFCIPYDLMSFGMSLFGEGTEVQIVNHPHKKSFLRGNSTKHNLYWNRTGIELTSYADSPELRESDRQYIISSLESYQRNPLNINLTISLLQRILLRKLGAKVETSKLGWKIKGVGFLPSVTFHRSRLQITRPMPKYLDEVGLVALAFYVDSPVKFELNSKLIHFLRVSKAFDVKIINKYFGIQILRFGGITYEFIFRR